MRSDRVMSANDPAADFGGSTGGKRTVPLRASSSSGAGSQLFLLRHRALGDGFVDLRLDSRHIETGSALHRWEVDQRLRRLANHLLDENETPELIANQL